MNNQERAESAFEYFMEHGEVVIGDISAGADMFNCVDVARLLWIDDIHPRRSFDLYGVIYRNRALTEIRALIDKHYVE